MSNAANVFEYSENMNTPDKKKIYSTYIKPDEEVDYNSLKKHMISDEIPNNVSMVIFSVMVELISMMRMQSLVTTSGKAALSIYFGEDKTLYYLRCDSIMKTEHAQTLVTYIERFNKHDKDELRRYFKYVRKASADGVGLELIEIARRATAPIGYSMTEHNNISSQFSLLVRIKKEGDK